MAKDMTSTGLSIDKKLWVRARDYADKQQRPFSWLVRKALREYLNKRKA